MSVPAAAKKRRVVSDWRRAWRWYSVHALIIAGALPAAWSAVPVAWKSGLPDWMLGVLAITTAVCGVIGRMTAQGDDA